MKQMGPQEWKCGHCWIGKLYYAFRMIIQHKTGTLACIKPIQRKKEKKKKQSIGLNILATPELVDLRTFRE